mgnify:CR=1 FL=1
MRGLLVVNPFATTTSGVTREQIVATLRHNIDLDVVETTHSGHATQLAHQATTHGIDVVIGFGGDGTMNEITNGVLQDGPQPNGTSIAAIPGGHANVFIRNLGIPADPLQATNYLVEQMDNAQPKLVGLGILSTETAARWFLFNAGIGLDAAVLARMQERRTTGKPANDLAYAGIAVHELLTHNVLAQPTLHITDQNNADVGTSQCALIINLAPWTYLGNRPLDVASDATLANALDVYAPHNLKPRAMGQFLRRIFTNQTGPAREAIHLKNQDFVSFSTNPSMWVQVDGEALQLASQISVTHVRDVIRVWT